MPRLRLLPRLRCRLPSDLDFEQGQPGEVPPGWFNSSAARTNGYTAKIVTDKPESGRQAVLVTLEGERKDPKAFGNLLTFFDATPYRGQRIRFRAAVRAEVEAGNQAALWVRVDREGGAMGFFDNMANRPITSGEWKTYEISGEVAPDAKAIFLGMMLIGEGKAWIDSASFETLGAPVVANDPPRPLDARGLRRTSSLSPACSAMSASSIPATRPPPRTGRSSPWPASRSPRSPGAPRSWPAPWRTSSARWRRRCASTPPPAGVRSCPPP